MASVNTAIRVEHETWQKFEQAARADGLITTIGTGEIRGNVSRWLKIVGLAEIERREQGTEQPEKQPEQVA